MVGGPSAAARLLPIPRPLLSMGARSPALPRPDGLFGKAGVRASISYLHNICSPAPPPASFKSNPTKLVTPLRRSGFFFSAVTAALSDRIACTIDALFRLRLRPLPSPAHFVVCPRSSAMD